jgi:hypothetical protein
MLRRIVCISVLAGLTSFVSLAAAAQEMVHALAGTVSSIDATAKTITVKTDDGSEILFNDLIDSKTPIEFDPNIRRDATAASEFKSSGVRVIVYYFGYGSIRTVVALRSLGAGPFTLNSGTVVNFSKGDRTLSIKDNSGVIKTFNINSDLVVEASTGASEKTKFQPAKGDPVRVTAIMVNGSATALFINTLVAN